MSEILTKPKATYRCPICSVDIPHAHTKAEIQDYYNIKTRKYTQELMEEFAAELKEKAETKTETDTKRVT